MVLWTGIAGVIGWLSAFSWSIRDMTVRFDWTNIGAAPTNEHFISIFLNPNWIGTGSRIQESVTFMVVAILITVVMWLARHTVRRQLELNEERQTITEVFGQFIPKAIANALIADQGALEPVERNVTILFSDIAGFTVMTEQRGAKKIVRVLNNYFDDITRIISAYDGVITQFQGDAILATFNVPLEDPEHAVKAVRGTRHPGLGTGEDVRPDGNPHSGWRLYRTCACRKHRRRWPVELHGARRYGESGR